MKKVLLVFLAVLLAVPVVFAGGGTVCRHNSPSGGACTYNLTNGWITACMDSLNNTAGYCRLDDNNTVYTIEGHKVYNFWGVGDNQVGIMFGYFANNATLDCNGTTLSRTIGIEAADKAITAYNLANITIKNCIITGDFYTAGILLKGVTGGNLINNTLINIDWGNPPSGINLDNSHNINVVNNTLTDVDGSEIHISGGSSDNIIDGNVITFTGPPAYNSGVGIVLTDTFNNTINNNEISKSGINGIEFLQNTSGNIASNNSFDSNLHGISLVGSSNTIIGNSFINGVYTQIHLARYAEYGVEVHPSYNDIVDNYIFNTMPGYGSAYGIEIDAGGYNNITNNTLVSNQNGILISGVATGTRIDNNTVEHSTDYGIYIDTNAQNNVISSNIISNTLNSYGLYIKSSNNTISENTFTSNGGSITTCSYYSSSYPRNWNGVNWSDLLGGPPGMLLLFATPPYVALLNSESKDVSSAVTGASNLSLALFNIPSYGNFTAIFNDAVATDCTGLEAFLAGLNATIHCAYFEPDVWKANGVCRSYTNLINSTTTAVSGFYTPSLVSIINPISGAIYIGNTDNSLTSNTFNSNTVSVTVLSGVYNTILGGIINLDNDLSLYIPGNLNVVINALIIGSTSGNYYLYKDSSIFNVSSSRGGISWRISNLTLNANLGTNLLFGPGFISLNTAALGGLNKKANVTITGVACDNFKLWYSSGFYSGLADIIANGAIVATNANINGDCTDTSICKHVQCLANTLKFEAQHFDGFGVEGEGATGNVSINLTSEVSIMVKYNIAYGEGRVDSDKSSAVLDSALANATDGTWVFKPQYLYIENDGTVNVSVNLTSSKTAASFIGGTNPEFKAKGIKTENGSCAVAFQTSYFDVTNTSRSICDLLQFGNSFDTFNVSTRLLIPSDAQTGHKESTLTFTAKKV